MSVGSIFIGPFGRASQEAWELKFAAREKLKSLPESGLARGLGIEILEDFNRVIDKKSGLARGLGIEILSFRSRLNPELVGPRKRPGN